MIPPPPGTSAAIYAPGALHAPICFESKQAEAHFVALPPSPIGRWRWLRRAAAARRALRWHLLPTCLIKLLLLLLLLQTEASAVAAFDSPSGCQQQGSPRGDTPHLGGAGNWGSLVSCRGGLYTARARAHPPPPPRLGPIGPIGHQRANVPRYLPKAKFSHPIRGHEISSPFALATPLYPVVFASELFFPVVFFRGVFFWFRASPQEFFLAMYGDRRLARAASTVLIVLVSAACARRASHCGRGKYEDIGGCFAW
jgi:hypothetical protein